MQRLRCQLFYLNTGAILSSKFNYSDVKLMKSPLPESYSFFFFIKKIFKNGKYTVEMHMYSPGLNSLPLCTRARFCMTPLPVPLPEYVLYGWPFIA